MDKLLIFPHELTVAYLTLLTILSIISQLLEGAGKEALSLLVEPLAEVDDKI